MRYLKQPGLLGISEPKRKARLFFIGRLRVCELLLIKPIPPNNTSSFLSQGVSSPLAGNLACLPCASDLSNDPRNLLHLVHAKAKELSRTKAIPFWKRMRNHSLVCSLQLRARMWLSVNKSTPRALPICTLSTSLEIILPPPGNKIQHQGCLRHNAQQSICRLWNRSRFLVSQSQFHLNASARPHREPVRV